jgi:endonuclease/exonuclease/phosphatase family metal-dependent hydrolase
MIKFASINIAGDMFRPKVVSFLRGFSPDVVCLEELTGPGLTFFEQELGMKGHFFPMGMFNTMPFDISSPVAPFGVGMFSKYPISNIKMDYYAGGVGELPTIVQGDEETVWRSLLQGMVNNGEEQYAFAVTHFTRTPDGSTSDKQRRDVQKMLEILSGTPEVILCGDFNAPRGGEIFKILADKYKDNIPPEYDSSLDTELHRVGKTTKLMVDGLFISPGLYKPDAHQKKSSTADNKDNDIPRKNVFTKEKGVDVERNASHNMLPRISE